LPLRREGCIPLAHEVHKAITAAASRGHTLTAYARDRPKGDPLHRRAVDAGGGNVLANDKFARVVAIDAAAAGLKLGLGVDAFERDTGEDCWDVDETRRQKSRANFVLLSSATSNSGHATTTSGKRSGATDVAIQDGDVGGTGSRGSRSDGRTALARVCAARANGGDGHDFPILASGEAGVWIGDRGGSSTSSESDSVVTAGEGDLAGRGDVVLGPLDLVDGVDEAE
jgi:hypothetical protein